MIDVTEQSFERDVLHASHSNPVLVEIWAPSSAPSRTLAATLERLELDMAGVFTLVRIDAGENALLLSRMGVKALPFALLFKDGEPVDGFVGTPRESTVRGFLSRHVSRPPGETLAAFAATGATLAIHLSIHRLGEVAAELGAHYGTDCPVAVVWRASWPDQRIVRGTLATIAVAVGETMERTALILVGRALAAEDFDESRLYAADYDRRFRAGRADAVTR